MDDIIYLISETNPHTDESSNMVYDVEEKEVFCRVGKITKDEYYRAGTIGLSSKFVFVTNKANYNDEGKLNYKGKVYQIYRTYPVSDDELELYAAEKEGVTYEHQY